MKIWQYGRQGWVEKSDLLGNIPQHSRHGRMNLALRWTFVVGLALMLIPGRSLGGSNPPPPPPPPPPPSCTPGTNGPTQSPNATFTVLSISRLTNYYCLGDSIAANVIYTNTVGTNVTYITNSDCSITTNKDSCSTSLWLTNCTWTATVGSWSTNGHGISTPTLKPTECGVGTVSFHVEWTNSCDGSTDSEAASGSFTVVDLLYQCIAATPTNQFRTTIGVGEEVALDISGLNDGVTWSTTAGTLTSYDQPYTSLIAPDREGTVTVTAFFLGTSLTQQFDVIEPSGVFFLTNALKHTYDRVDIGFHALIYLQPDSVNFGAVECQEQQAYCVATGCYSQYNGSGHQATNAVSFGNTVVVGRGTGDGIASDTCYSGATDILLHIPYTPGTETLAIPWDFRANGGAWKTSFITLTWLCSESNGGYRGDGILNASKSNASCSFNVNDPSVDDPCFNNF